MELSSSRVSQNGAFGVAQWSCGGPDQLGFWRVLLERFEKIWQRLWIVRLTVLPTARRWRPYFPNVVYSVMAVLGMCVNLATACERERTCNFS